MVTMKIQFLVLHMMVGLSYQRCRDGDTNNDGCVPEKCKGGRWIPDSNLHLDQCLKCFAFGDPHFEVFSGARFDWHEGCNYALVQAGTSINPEFGVFMTFDEKDTVAYIGTPTTYQDNSNTKIVIHDKNQANLFDVSVNGKKETVSARTPTQLHLTTVFAWKHSTYQKQLKISADCLRLYGKTQILVEFCQSQITIWAPPGHLYPVTLGGLCGTTDDTAIHERKLVARNGVKYSDPMDWNKLADKTFAESWKTKDQTISKCQSGGKRKRSPRKLRSLELREACRNDAKSMSGTHHGLCSGVHPGTNGGSGDDHVDACKFDLCMVANGTEHRTAGYGVDWILDQHNEIHSRTRFHKNNTIGRLEPETFSGQNGIVELTRPVGPAPVSGQNGIVELIRPVGPAPVSGQIGIVELIRPVEPAPGTIGLDKPIGLGGSIGRVTSFQPSNFQPQQQGAFPFRPGTSGLSQSPVFPISPESINLQPSQLGGSSLSAAGRSGLHLPFGNTNSQPASFRKRLQPGGSTAQGEVVPILVDERDGPNADGSYSFNFETDDGTFVQEQGYQKASRISNVVKKGTYWLTYPDGTKGVFKWIADENGFRVESPLLPTPPPIPPHAQNLLVGINQIVTQTHSGQGFLNAHNEEESQDKNQLANDQLAIQIHSGQEDMAERVIQGP